MKHFIFALLLSTALSASAWAEDDDDGASDGLKVVHQASSTTKDMSDAASNLSDTVKTIKGGGDGGDSGGDASDASSDVQSALQSLQGQGDSGGQGQSGGEGSHEGWARDGHEGHRFAEEREHRRLEEERAHGHWAHTDHERRDMAARDHRGFGGEKARSGQPGFFQRLGNSMHNAGQKFQAAHGNNMNRQSRPMMARGAGASPKGVTRRSGKPVQVAR